jgi:hypothetical protein
MELGGVAYVEVDLEPPLDDRALDVLGILSSVHAAFEVEADGRLRPIPLRRRLVVDDDLLTIQRYAGKTNEAFTHLLVNVTLAHAGDAFDRLVSGESVRLLDPMCGRGTTLNRAVAYGMDGIGLEADRGDVDAYVSFFTTWLQDKRWRHTVERSVLRRGRPTTAHRTLIAYGHGRDRALPRQVDVVHDDTAAARDHVVRRSVDLLVGDLPYGVQHRASTHGGADRGLEAVLADALPVWFELLRPGAAAGLAWNRPTLPRSRLADLLSSAGFEVGHPGDESFVHRVDRSITRDVIVGVRPI